MNKKLTSYAIIVMMITIGISSCLQCSAAAPEDPPLAALQVNFTIAPNPGFYKEYQYFYGTATGGSGNYTWEWEFPNGEFYPGYDETDQNTIYKIYPPDPFNWRDNIYEVVLRVYDNEVPTSGIKRKDSTITVNHHLSGWITAPLGGLVGHDITFSCTAWNKGDHICPKGYRVRREIWIGIPLVGPLWLYEELDDYIGPYDLNPDGMPDDEHPFNTVWRPVESGCYFLRIWWEPRMDDNPNAPDKQVNSHAVIVI